MKVTGLVDNVAFKNSVAAYILNLEVHFWSVHKNVDIGQFFSTSEEMFTLLATNEKMSIRLKPFNLSPHFTIRTFRPRYILYP